MHSPPRADNQKWGGYFFYFFFYFFNFFLHFLRFCFLTLVWSIDPQHSWWSSLYFSQQSLLHHDDAHSTNTKEWRLCVRSILLSADRLKAGFPLLRLRYAHAALRFSKRTDHSIANTSVPISPLKQQRSASGHMKKDVLDIEWSVLFEKRSAAWA